MASFNLDSAHVVVKCHIVPILDIGVSILFSTVICPLFSFVSLGLGKFLPKLEQITLFHPKIG
jgi:hypothetical protein